MERVCFKSTLFQVQPGEDEETNPFCYGKELAEWLKKNLESKGYEVEDVIPEDWGWCVMCQRTPFCLWVGCTNMRSRFYDTVTPEEKENFIPDVSDLTWVVFIESRIPFFKKLFTKIDTGQMKKKLSNQLMHLLENEPTIEYSECE